jgi:hypothetical protein
LAALGLCAGCPVWSWEPHHYPVRSSLRWLGDARLAGGADGTALLGPMVRFRAGSQLRAPPPPSHNPPARGYADVDPAHVFDPDEVERARRRDRWLDALVGSWGGLELSFGALSGAVAGDRPGTLALAAIRPWLSPRQTSWLLRTDQLSVLGVLVPEVGAAYGMGEGPRLHLGWELPLGNEVFQVVPGVSWLSPGGAQRLLGTLALRVPM